MYGNSVMARNRPPRSAPPGSHGEESGSLDRRLLRPVFVFSAKKLRQPRGLP